MSEDEIQRAYELVRVQKLSYSQAGKILGGIPKSTIRAAVTREAVRRAGAPVPESEPAGDPGLLAALGLAEPVSKAATPDASDAEDEELGDEDDELLITPDDGEPLNAVTVVKRQIRLLERRIELLNRRDMVGEAQKYTRTLAGLIKDLRQLERMDRDADGVLTYTKADADAACAALDARAAKVEEQGLRCEDCGRALRRRKAEE